VTKPARFTHEQNAGRYVPDFQIFFPEPVKASGGDPGEVERGRAEAADPRHFGRDGVEDLLEAVELPVPVIGNAGRDQRVGRSRRDETRRRRSLSQAPLPFSAQKLSSVSGW
jgi:hypothetical protein